jgi:DNA polymerase-4
MDAFFASVEQQSNPALRGKPIAVIGAGARTVITTSSYEAREYGVKTGMTIYEAKRLCPHMTFVTGNNKKYAQISTMLAEICLLFTPDIEIYSIDEVFLDVTGSHHLLNGSENLAWTIKDMVKKELGITCTVGMGHNILIAKLASDLAKPDGLRWIGKDMISSVLETLPVKKLWGIGSHTEEKLRDMGIRTCGELGRAPLSLLTRKFGVLGERLQAMGNGMLDRPLELVTPEPKSIGHSTTFPKDLWKREELEPQFLRLSEMVGRRARRYGYKGRKVTLTVRYADFKTFTKQTTLTVYTNDTGQIYRTALAILDGIRLKKSIRLLGVSLSSFGSNEQLTLFEETNHKERAALLRTMDAVNDKYGEYKITWASAATEKKGHGVISPAWRPSGIRKSDV